MYLFSEDYMKTADSLSYFYLISIDKIVYIDGDYKKIWQCIFL